MRTYIEEYIEVVDEDIRRDMEYIKSSDNPIKEDVFHDWQTTSSTQEKEREKLYSLLKAIDLLEEKMWAVSDNAHVLKINSDKLKSRK